MDIWRAIAKADAGKFSAAVHAAGEDFDVNARAGYDESELVQFGTTLLIESVQQCSLQCVSAVLEAGADANAANAVGDTPLIAACRGGDIALVQVLLEGGAHPSRTQQPPAGAPHTPLSAAAFGAAEFGPELTAAKVQALVSAGAQADTPYGPGGLRPLHILVRAGTDGLAAVRVLLEAGADANLPTAAEGKEFTPLQWAILADAPGVTEMVQLLLEHGAQPNVGIACLNVLEPPLMSAAAAFQGGAFRLLLEHGADITHVSYTKHSVLDFACRALSVKEQEQGIRIVRDVLSHSDAQRVLAMKGPKGKTPLLSAVRAGFSDAVHALLAAGLSGLERSEGGEPLLVVAADAQSPGVLEALLVHGADVHAKVDKNSRETALLAACRCPVVPTAQRARGTVFSAGSAGGAAAHASSFSDLWAKCPDAGALMVCMLLRAGANPNTVCAFKGSALHRTGLGGNTAAAEALLEHASESRTTLAVTEDGLGRTPADVAVQQGQHELLQLLLDHPTVRGNTLSRGQGLVQQAFDRKHWRCLMSLLVRPEAPQLATDPGSCDRRLLLPAWAMADPAAHPYQLNYEGNSWCTFLTLLAHRSPLVAPYTGAMGVPMCATSRLAAAEATAAAAGATEEQTRPQQAQNRSWWVPSFVTGLFGGGAGGAAVAPATPGQAAVAAVDLTATGLFKWEDTPVADGQSRLLSGLGAKRVLLWLGVFPTGYTPDASQWVGNEDKRLISLMSFALVLGLDRRHRLRAKAAADSTHVSGGVLQCLSVANWHLRRTLLLQRAAAANADHK